MGRTREWQDDVESYFAEIGGTNRSYLRIAQGVNNGMVYISRAEGKWHSEYGTPSDWFENHWDSPRFAVQMFAGWVDNR